MLLAMKPKAGPRSPPAPRNPERRGVLPEDREALAETVARPGRLSIRCRPIVSSTGMSDRDAIEPDRCHGGRPPLGAGWQAFREQPRPDRGVDAQLEG